MMSGGEVVPITGGFGAEVLGLDLSEPLSRSQRSTLDQAFADHRVLAIRDQDLRIEDLEAFALSLGNYGETPFITPIDGHPNVLRVVREADESGPLFGSGWHSDWSFQSEPPSATILYAVDLPPVGGDTAFTDQEAAFATLSPTMQSVLSGLRGVHSARRSYGPQGTFGRNDPAAAMDIHGGDSALATQVHPLVRVHPVTGRSSLFVNEVYTIGIDGMTDAEAAPLLRLLFEHSRNVNHTCRIRWEPGTVTMWDNRCVQHFAINDYNGHRREMLRITLAGEQPIPG